MTRTALLLLALAAPVPPHRPRPPAEVTPGRYAVSWASLETEIRLLPGGGYEASWYGRPWRGSWYWEAKERTLHIQESEDQDRWYGWKVRLDGELKGNTTPGPDDPYGAVAVTVKAIKGKR